MLLNIDQLVLKAAEKLREKATGRIPFLTGDLRKSVQVQSLGSGKASVGSNLPYARPVHDGRKAITIRPKNKKVLKFKIGGRNVFAKMVRQPARKGRPFLREAADEMRREGFGFLMPDLKKAVGKEVAEKIIKKIKIG